MHGANSSVHCVSRWVDTWHTTKYNIAMHTAVTLFLFFSPSKFVRCIHSSELDMEFMLVKNEGSERCREPSQAKQAYYVRCTSNGNRQSKKREREKAEKRRQAMANVEFGKLIYLYHSHISLIQLDSIPFNFAYLHTYLHSIFTNVWIVWMTSYTTFALVSTQSWRIPTMARETRRAHTRRTKKHDDGSSSSGSRKRVFLNDSRWFTKHGISSSIWVDLLFSLFFSIIHSLRQKKKL